MRGILDLTLEEMRVARLYFLGKRMTSREMALFRRSAKKNVSKREIETMRLMRARFMRKKRLRKMM